MNKEVLCPTCKTLIKWDSSNPFRPFCCERCKLIDLGAWADGSYSIPDDTQVNDIPIDDSDQDP